MSPRSTPFPSLLGPFDTTPSPSSPLHELTLSLPLYSAGCSEPPGTLDRPCAIGPSPSAHPGCNRLPIPTPGQPYKHSHSACRCNLLVAKSHLEHWTSPARSAPHPAPVGPPVKHTRTGMCSTRCMSSACNQRETDEAFCATFCAACAHVRSANGHCIMLIGWVGCPPTNCTPPCHKRPDGSQGLNPITQELSSPGADWTRTWSKNMSLMSEFQPAGIAGFSAHGGAPVCWRKQRPRQSFSSMLWLVVRCPIPTGPFTRMNLAVLYWLVPVATEWPPGM